MSAYASDVLNISDRLSVMASLRIDNFKSTASDESNDQTALSPKFGIVYQVIENKVSLFPVLYEWFYECITKTSYNWY